MAFFQDAPVLANLYTQDAFLRAEFARRVPKDICQAQSKFLENLGHQSVTQYSLWQDEADKNPPTLTQFDAWGRRMDRINEARHWQDFRQAAVEWQIVGRGHSKDLGPFARVVQTAYMLLFAPTTANYLCPLAMTDAAACVVRRLAPPSLKERLYGRLIAKDSAQAITSGQWMTERPGGSDVSRTETLAHYQTHVGEEARFRLYGVKWFTSSISSEMALLLAQVMEDKTPKGLTLFCWERPDMPGSSPKSRVKVLRLKDKLGTRALPTAEIELDGTLVSQIGEIGRGVSHIAEMLNVTRFYNAVASAASMNFSSLLVEDYGRRRQAFGRPVGEHALMKEVQRDLQTQSAAATALCFEVASLLGKCEVGDASRDEQLCMRAMVPLAKLLLGKATVAHASETLECFGGAGYIEDTGLPRILRDAQVLPIWEGTTNVLALDLWRAERKEGAVSALVAKLITRSETLLRGGSSEVKELCAAAQTLRQTVERLLSQSEEEAQRQLRRLAFDLGASLQKLLLLEHAASDTRA